MARGVSARPRRSRRRHRTTNVPGSHRRCRDDGRRSTLPRATRGPGCAGPGTAVSVTTYGCIIARRAIGVSSGSWFMVCHTLCEGCWFDRVPYERTEVTVSAACAARESRGSTAVLSSEVRQSPRAGGNDTAAVCGCSPSAGPAARAASAGGGPPASSGCRRRSGSRSRVAGHGAAGWSPNRNDSSTKRRPRLTGSTSCRCAPENTSASPAAGR